MIASAGLSYTCQVISRTAENNDPDEEIKQQGQALHHQSGIATNQGNAARRQS